MSFGFGRYRGVPLPEIPDGYLYWILSQDWIWPTTRVQVEAELDTRLREREWEQRQRRARSHQRSPSASAGPGVDSALAAQVVKRGFKALTLEQHPDVGGSHEGMIRLTATKNWLLGVVQQALPRVPPEEEEWR